MPTFNMIGLGATLAVNDGSGGAGSASGAIIDIITMTIPDPELGSVDSKRLNLSGGLIGKLAALKEPGELTFQYECSKGKKDRLDALIGSNRVWVATLPDAGDGVYTKSIPGFLKSNKIDPVAADGMVMATAAIQVNGAQT